MWVKPKESNSWGHVSTYYGNIRREGDGAYAEVIAGAHRVRWPDGTEEVLDVHMGRITETTYDHGRSDTVQSRIPMIDIVHHGATFRVRLASAGCHVFCDAELQEASFAAIDARDARLSRSIARHRKR